MRGDSVPTRKGGTHGAGTLSPVETWTAEPDRRALGQVVALQGASGGRRAIRIDDLRDRRYDRNALPRSTAAPLTLVDWRLPRTWPRTRLHTRPRPRQGPRSSPRKHPRRVLDAALDAALDRARTTSASCVHHAGLGETWAVASATAALIPFARVEPHAQAHTSRRCRTHRNASQPQLPRTSRRLSRRQVGPHDVQMLPWARLRTLGLANTCRRFSVTGPKPTAQKFKLKCSARADDRSPGPPRGQQRRGWPAPPQAEFRPYC